MYTVIRLVQGKRQALPCASIKTFLALLDLTPCELWADGKRLA